MPGKEGCVSLPNRRDSTEVVLLGPLLNAQLRLWWSNGRADCVRVAEADRLARLLGRGVVARTDAGPVGRREVGLLDTNTHILAVQGRSDTESSHGEHAFLDAPFEVEVCEDPPASDDIRVAFIEWLQDAATAATTRGEVLVVEPGGREPGPVRYALARAVRARDAWVLNVEATPAVRNSPWWPEPYDGAADSAMDAAADANALADIGTVLFEAIATWASSPLDVVLTFEPNPDGSWPGPDNANGHTQRPAYRSAEASPTRRSPLDNMIGMWNDVVAQFLVGEAALPDPLNRWFDSYRPAAAHPVGRDTLPEPYLGRLDRPPAGICLALNPGVPHIGNDDKPDFQSRNGIFARDIQRAGTFRAWAETWPYFGEPWMSSIGASRHHCNHLTFLQHWHEDPSLTADAMVAFDLYPWHTTDVTAVLRPDPAIIRRYVWEPICELGNPPVFAFGAAWFSLLEHLGLRELLRLGKGGKPYGSTIESRSVVVFRDRSGIEVVAEKHSGRATPPNADEVARLRDALADNGIVLSHFNH
jgi:hypothetical protein